MSETLATRLQRRAEACHPDKPQPMLRRIIEVRSVLAEQHLRGLSWTALADLLAAEGLNLTAGTLRNYMNEIGHVVDHLRAQGHADPSDAEIHAALRKKRGPLPSPKPLRPAPPPLHSDAPLFAIGTKPLSDRDL